MYVLIKISGARIVILFELYSFIFSPAVRCADRILLITRQIIFEKKKTKKKTENTNKLKNQNYFRVTITNLIIIVQNGTRRT